MVALVSPLKTAMGAMRVPAGPSAPAAPPPADPPTSLSPTEEDRYLTDFEGKYGIPPGLYARLIKVGENSGYTATSDAGAYGRAQLMEGTARDMGVDRKNPVQNLEGGAKYLKWLHEQLGDWPQAVAAYNDGIGRVRKAGGIPEDPKVRDYVRRVTGQMAETSKEAASAAFAPALDKALEKVGADDKAYEAAAGKAHAADADFAGRLDTLDGKIGDVSALIEKIGAQTPSPPPTQKLPGYQAPQPKNPMQMLAGAMPLILLAGSKMGRNKGLALMNTMSGMLSGANAGNEEVRRQYQEDFKAKSEELIEQAKLDHEHYAEILQDLREQKGDALAKVQVFAAQSENDALRHAAQTGDLKRVADLASIHGQFFGSVLQAYNAALTSERNAVEQRLQRERIDIDRGRLDETRRYHDEQSPLKRMAAAEKLRNDVDKSPLGKAYANLDQYAHVIDNSEAKIARGEKLGSQEQAAFLDAFTKIVTGGQAIRGFQLKLNTDHAGLADKAGVLMQQAGTGGPLSPRMEKEMVGVVREYTKALSGEYQGAIGRADDFAKKAGVIGSDETVAPFEVDPSKLSAQAGPAPGTVEGGFRFKGGDAAKPENWEPVH